MQLIKYLPFVALLPLLACGGPAPVTEAELTEGEWAFSLANPAKPNRLDRFIGAGQHLYPGARLRLTGDSLYFTNLRNDRTVTKARLGAVPTVDSAGGYLVEPGFGQTLRLAVYEGDSLAEEYVFERPSDQLDPLPPGALNDQGFHFQYPGKGQLFVYFNQDENVTYYAPKDKPLLEYFYSHTEQTQERKTTNFKNNPGQRNISYFTPELLRNVHFFRFHENDSFGKERHVLFRRPDGTLVTTWISQDSNKYVRNEMVLTPAPSVCPPGATAADFAAQFNAGRVVIDNTYPEIDSADVSYLYTDRFLQRGGLEYDELTELEMSMDPAGAFILSSRGRIIKDFDWRLVPAGNLIEVNEPDEKRTRMHFPILSWSDDLIELRMPLMVKTREPRGVEMESYGILDAYVRVEAPGRATSTR